MLPPIVQPWSIAVPWLATPPPEPVVEPPVIVRPERVAVTLEAIRNHSAACLRR